MKVGILTIHRILNFGSSLQAYALQNFIEKELKHCSCSIIDYRYPNSYHINSRRNSLTFLKFMRLQLHKLKESLNMNLRLQKKQFQIFWNNEFNLTRSFLSQQEILNDSSLQFDIYIAGSDQIWSTKTLYGDPIFMFSFLDDKIKRFSYASSFGQTSIDRKYENIFQVYLRKFSSIGVREFSGLKILNDLGLGNISQLVCDPTLLLSSKEYNLLAAKSSLDIQDNFILVYCLDYAFNPYPTIADVIEKVRTKFDSYKLVFLGKKIQGFNSNTTCYKHANPYDFLYLFSKASYIITSSFHGTAFSVIYRKPFTTISPRKTDMRIFDFLHTISLHDHIVYNDGNTNTILYSSSYTKEVLEKINKYIDDSKKFLKHNLNNI